MDQIKLYVTLKLPSQYFENYSNTEDYIIDKLYELAEGVEGSVYDLEIK